jgi:hypothetical protein
MKSKVKGRNYVILRRDDCRIPEMVNKKRLDNALVSLEKAFSAICEVLDDLYRNDRSAHSIVEDNALYWVLRDRYELSDSSCFDLDRVLDDIHELRVFLATHDDEIRPEEEVITLNDLGFREEIPGGGFRWEKCIEDNDEREIVEEICILEDGPVRRIRTIEWEKTDYGKSSKSIRYKKMPIGKRMMKAINNITETENE